MNDHIYIYWDDLPLSKPTDNVQAKGELQAQVGKEPSCSMASGTGRTK